MKKETIKKEDTKNNTLKCDCCGYEFDKDEDIDDFKHIEDTGECEGCFKIE